MQICLTIGLSSPTTEELVTDLTHEWAQIKMICVNKFKAVICKAFRG